MSKSIPIGTIKQSSFEFYAYDSDEDINGPEEKSGKSGPPLKPQLPAPTITSPQKIVPSKPNEEKPITLNELKPQQQVTAPHSTNTTSSRLGASVSAQKENQSLGLSVHMQQMSEEEYGDINWGDSSPEVKRTQPVRETPNLNLWPTAEVVQQLDFQNHSIKVTEPTGHPIVVSPRLDTFRKPPHLDIPNSNYKLEPSANQQGTGFKKKEHKGGKISSQKELPAVVSFILSSNPLRVKFTNNDDTSAEKTITTDYLSYLEQYFPLNYNKLVPLHTPEFIQGITRATSYLTVYFKFIVECYPQQLYKFLKEEHYQPPPTTESNTLEKFKGQFFNTLQQGISFVSGQIKRFRPEQTTQSNKLERLENTIVLQLAIAQKMKEFRKTALEDFGVTIQPSAYELGNPDKKYECLSTLDWLMNFQQTIDISEKQITNHESKGERVQADKLRRMLIEFREIQTSRKGPQQLQQCLNNLART